MKQIKFTKDFLWGSAFSGPQTEGAAFEDGRSSSNWDEFYKTQKNRFFDELDCKNDFYHRYEEDIKLAQKLNFNSLRTSIQWTRLIPDGKNINEKGVKFYDNLINKMLEHKIEPIINLFHFDMPTWAQNKGGWESKEVIEDFVFFAKTCFELFGDRVKKFSTMCEPIVVVEAGYLYDSHYPLEVNMQKAMQVQWNSLIAHLKAVKEFRKLNLSGQIGCILNISPAIARSNHPADILAAKRYDLFLTNCYLDPLIKQQYPQEIINLAKKYNFMWKISKEDLTILKDKTLKVDFLGINYYCPQRVKALDYAPDFKNGAITTEFFFQRYIMPGRKMNPYRGWEIYPKGIYITLTNIRDNYGNIPVFISENGMGVEAEERFLVNGKINDEYRIQFLKDHLAWLNKAIEDGCNCFGYHSWAYIDNWSWMNAYKNRYGFIQLDLKNKGKRIPKKSAAFITKTIKDNGFEYDKDIN